MCPLLDLSGASKPQCPRCRRSMVNLADYSKDLESGVAGMNSNDSLRSVDSGVGEFFWLDWLFGLFAALTILTVRAAASCLGPEWKKQRVRRLAHRYPRSLYCPRCGYLQRLV